MLVIPKNLLPLLLFALPSLADEGILDCLTGPCVTVPGVGKLQGTLTLKKYLPLKNIHP